MTNQEAPAPILIEEEQRSLRASFANLNKMPDYAKVATAVIAGGLSALAISACGGEHHKTVAASNGETNAAAAVMAPSCGGTEHFSELLSNSLNNVGSSESMFPLMQHAENGQEQLDPVETAKEKLIKQIEGDPRALGLMYTFFVETQGKVMLPNSATLADAENNIANFVNYPNSDATINALNITCQLINNELQINDNFNVVRGEGTYIDTDHEDGKVSDIHFSRVDVPEDLSVYSFGFVDDDTSLDQAQKDTLRELSKLIGITGDGRILISEWVGPGSFNINYNGETKAPAKIELDHKNHKVKVLVMPGKEYKAPSSNNNSNHESTSSNSTTSNTNHGGSGSGTYGTSKNNGESNHPGSVKESGGGAGHQTGTTPSYGPGRSKTGGGSGKGTGTGTKRGTGTGTGTTTETGPTTTTTSTVPTSTTTETVPTTTTTHTTTETVPTTTSTVPTKTTETVPTTTTTSTTTETVPTTTTTSTTTETVPTTTPTTTTAPPEKAPDPNPTGTGTDPGTGGGGDPFDPGGNPSTTNTTSN
jgi:hypothetical protein